MSIRGFGSRSTYGVRGLRLYVDGIPATMPDGRGQTSNIDIGSIDSLEVLRGPFSALYGNSSGGVINVNTQNRQPAADHRGQQLLRQLRHRHYGLKATGAVGDGTRAGDVDYTVSTNRFTTHGSRDHSGARKKISPTPN